jgi:hypothetical protein
MLSPFILDYRNICTGGILQALLFLGVAGDAVIQISLLLLQLAIAPLNQHINKQNYNVIISLLTLLLVFFPRSYHRFSYVASLLLFSD